MKRFIPLIILASVSSLLTIILYIYAFSQPGGTGAALAFIVLWMPAVWITTIILALVFTIVLRKKLFIKGKTKWTLLLLLFCTPIPIFLGYLLTHPIPETYRSSSWYRHQNGKIYKTESWIYNTSNYQKYLDMYFVADSLEEIKNGEDAFIRDSTWIYFTKAGDTLKVERYKAGQLTSTKQYQKE